MQDCFYGLTAFNESEFRINSLMLPPLQTVGEPLITVYTCRCHINPSSLDQLEIIYV